MPKSNVYIGYGEDNVILNMLEDLYWSAKLRANDLMRSDEDRRVSQAAADAYAHAQHLIINKEKFNG